jgi:hypothetical protein
MKRLLDSAQGPFQPSPMTKIEYGVPWWIILFFTLFNLAGGIILLLFFRAQIVQSSTIDKHDPFASESTQMFHRVFVGALRSGNYSYNVQFTYPGLFRNASDCEKVTTYLLNGTKVDESDVKITVDYWSERVDVLRVTYHMLEGTLIAALPNAQVLSDCDYYPILNCTANGYSGGNDVGWNEPDSEYTYFCWTYFYTADNQFTVQCNSKLGTIYPTISESSLKEREIDPQTECLKDVTRKVISGIDMRDLCSYNSDSDKRFFNVYRSQTSWVTAASSANSLLLSLIPLQLGILKLIVKRLSIKSNNQESSLQALTEVTPVTFPNPASAPASAKRKTKGKKDVDMDF